MAKAYFQTKAEISRIGFSKFKKFLETELTDDKEWVKYQDDSVQYVKENWPGVIKECLTDKMFPTLLFYEKGPENAAVDRECCKPRPAFEAYEK